jgi:hypothetical protein
MSHVHNSNSNNNATGSVSNNKTQQPKNSKKILIKMPENLSDDDEDTPTEQSSKIKKQNAQPTVAPITSIKQQQIKPKISVQVDAIPSAESSSKTSDHIVGRNLLSTKKESIESIRKHQIEKKSTRTDLESASSNDINESTATAISTAAGVKQRPVREIYAEQNHNLAYELEKARVIIAKKTEENAHVVSELFDLREYIISLEKNLAYFKDQFDMKETELFTFRSNMSTMFKMIHNYETKMFDKNGNMNTSGRLDRTYDSSQNESSTYQNDSANSSNKSHNSSTTPQKRRTHLAGSLGKSQTPKILIKNDNDEEIEDEEEAEEDEEEEEEEDEELDDETKNVQEAKNSDFQQNKHQTNEDVNDEENDDDLEEESEIEESNQQEEQEEEEGEEEDEEEEGEGESEGEDEDEDEHDFEIATDQLENGENYMDQDERGGKELCTILEMSSETTMDASRISQNISHSNNITSRDNSQIKKEPKETLTKQNDNEEDYGEEYEVDEEDEDVTENDSIANKSDDKTGNYFLYSRKYLKIKDIEMTYFLKYISNQCHFYQNGEASFFC